MTKITFGIDPDSKKHGVSIYKDGKLVDLIMNDTIELMCTIKMWQESIDFNSKIILHIEDVNGVSAAFMARDKKTNINVKLKMAQQIGQCKQAQIEVERLCDFLGVEVVKHKISKMWKNQDGKKVFERVTGWTGRSNEDSRSAAYFGWLGVTS